MLTRSGDDLFCIAATTPGDAQALATRLRAEGDWLEVVPGIASVAVRFDAVITDAATARKSIEAVVQAGTEHTPEPGELIEIPVVYGGEYGPDLDALAEATGRSADELIALHTSGEYPVDMVGFTPGFAFIGGLDPCFEVPRRKEPRQRVAAGSVGIADGRTGLYAMASPGGWNIIGRTPRRLFEPRAENPFVLTAGMRVRFRAVAADEFDA